MRVPRAGLPHHPPINSRKYTRKWFLMDVGVAGVGANAAWDGIEKVHEKSSSEWKKHRNGKPYPTTKTHKLN